MKIEIEQSGETDGKVTIITHGTDAGDVSMQIQDQVKRTPRQLQTYPASYLSRRTGQEARYAGPHPGPTRVQNKARLRK